MTDQEAPLTPLERLRRTFITAQSCLKNFAYYRAARRPDLSTLPVGVQDIKNRITNNFLDIGVLDWCKLFVWDERHAWNRIVPHPQRERFLPDLLVHLGIDGPAWEAHIAQCRTYRDKFLAHLDSERTMHIPALDHAVEATVFLGRYLRTHHSEARSIPAHEMELRAIFVGAQTIGEAYFRLGAGE
jgi:hypothetical protein